MLTIIFVTQDFGVIENGPGIFAQYLWDYFRDDGRIRFYVVCASSTISHSQIVVVDLPESNGIFSSYYRYKRVSERATELALATKGKVVIHFNSAFTNFVKVSKAPNLFVIGQVNDYEAAQAFKKSLSKLRRYGMRRVVSLMWRHLQEQKAVKRQHLTICNSNFTMSKVLMHYGCRKTSVRTIYKSVDYFFFQEGERVDGPELRIVFVGNDWRRKGLEDLLTALTFLTVPYKLQIAGLPNSSLPVVRHLISLLNLENHIVLTSNVSRVQLRDILYSADVFVLPSHGEALGVSIIEALATGIPAICYRVGGIPEIITDSHNGWLVEEGDIDGLVRCLNIMGTNPSLRKQMGARAQTSLEIFSKSYMVQQYERLYLSL